MAVDGAHRDKDGDYQITGRIDDVIYFSGHRMGTAEMESALVAHPKVAVWDGGSSVKYALYIIPILLRRKQN
jgi:acyl-CoA synthetase (AMP-forming)/AMP-acid ligase II